MAGWSAACRLPPPAPASQPCPCRPSRGLLCITTRLTLPCSSLFHPFTHSLFSLFLLLTLLLKKPSGNVNNAEIVMTDNVTSHELEGCFLKDTKGNLQNLCPTNDLTITKPSGKPFSGEFWGVRGWRSKHTEVYIGLHVCLPILLWKPSPTYQIYPPFLNNVLYSRILSFLTLLEATSRGNPTV